MSDLMMAPIIPLIKRNEKAKSCFLKVKKDYLKFLNEEKIFDQSIKTKITSLKKYYIPMSFWIENEYKIEVNIILFYNDYNEL